jgi:hypothetical protein
MVIACDTACRLINIPQRAAENLRMALRES